MACTPFHTAEGASGLLCSRGRRAKVQTCGCGRTATRLCDGRVPSLAGRTRRCDRPVCDTHATRVGDELDWCPECVAVDEARRTALRPVSLPDALVAYTDGSGNVAHEPSGVGVVVYDCALEIPAVILEASAHTGLGTNNFAELTAVRYALWMCGVAALQRRRLLVRSDSTYTIDSLCADAPPPYADSPNAALIVAIRSRIAQRGRVWFEHVKGHTGERGNERADELASLGRLRGVEERAPAMPRAAAGGAR